jgi:prepilin-type N-terminal cleavage/methylation domain-containing protein
VHNAASRSRGTAQRSRTSAVMTMSRNRCPESSDGFTLIELMTVVAILGILVSMATVLYDHFVINAKSVEGEIVVHEIDRLEQLYDASHHVYTDSLPDLGFAMTGTMKYYTPEVRTGSAIDKISYQVRALPVTASATDAWLLTRYRDGSVQVDRIPVSDLVMFATIRYVGNAAAMTSVEASNLYLDSGMSSNNEPEWTDVGSNAWCHECGHTVINSINNRTVSATSLK